MDEEEMAIVSSWKRAIHGKFIVDRHLRKGSVLIYLSHFTERDRFANKDDKYAWKGYDFDMLNKLDEQDYIRQGSHRSKSMYITKEGEKKAKELLEKYNIADW